jgi:hypothetical protein
MSQSYADYTEGLMTICNCDKTDRNRNHQHNITGENVKWEWCYALSHCPSFCDGIVYKHNNRHGSFRATSIPTEYKGKHRRVGGPKVYRGPLV